MKRILRFSLAVLIGLTAPLGASARDLDCRQAAKFDNMFFKGKPGTAADGLSEISIVYSRYIWPKGADQNAVPDKKAYQDYLARLVKPSGPIVIDIEHLPLEGTPDTVRKHLSVLAAVADWTRESYPQRLVGFYGTGTIPNVSAANRAAGVELARHVNAFFPSLYTRSDDLGSWTDAAEQAVKKARAIDDRKPVFLYLMPYYYPNTPRAGEAVDTDFWKFQLQTAMKIANGFVIWSTSERSWETDWDRENSWWGATKDILKACR